MTTDPTDDYPMIIESYLNQDPHLGGGLGVFTAQPADHSTRDSPPGAFPFGQSTAMDVDQTQPHGYHGKPLAHATAKRKASDEPELRNCEEPSSEDGCSDTTGFVTSDGTNHFAPKRARHVRNQSEADQVVSPVTIVEQTTMALPALSRVVSTTPPRTPAPQRRVAWSPGNPFVGYSPIDHFHNPRTPTTLESPRGDTTYGLRPPPLSDPKGFTTAAPTASTSTNPFTQRLLDKGKARATDPPPENDPGSGDRNVPATQGDISDIHFDVRELTNSFKGLGVAVTALVEQNAELLDVLKDRFTRMNDTPQANTARGGRKRHDKAPGAQEASMELDPGVDGGDEEEAEHDEPLPPPPRAPKVSFKKTGLPRRRSPQENALKAAIRVLAGKYMHRKSADAPFDEDLLPSEEDVSAFQDKDGPCCSVEDFRPDLLSTPGTAWNQSVADVFVEGYSTEGAVHCDDKDLIRKYFLRHLKYLIQKFNEDHDAEEIRARLKARRRQERRNYLFQRRLRAAYTDPSLHRHAGVLQRLGPQGMSSDESAMENGVKQFQILKKSWRNPGLDDWLRVFDGIAREERHNFVTGSSRGAEARARFISGKIDDSTRPVIALPADAYSQDWLDTLTEYQRIRLRVQAGYGFTHTPEVRVRANTLNGKHNKIRAPRFR